MRAYKPILLGFVLILAWLLPATAGDEQLPRYALKRIGSPRWCSGDDILSLACSPDGRHLASGSRNDVVRLWNARGQLVRTFKDYWVWALAFSPDGKYLATAGAHKMVRLWNVKTGKEIHAKKMAGHKATIKALAFDPQGETLVSAGDDGTLHSWNLADGSLLEVRRGHTGSINAIDIAPDGQTIVSAGSDHTIRFWTDKESVLRVRTSVESVAFLNDKMVIGGGGDGFIRVWDKDNAKEIRQWKAHAGPISRFALSADRKTLVTSGLDNQVHVWDVSKATRLRSVDTKLCSVRARLGDSAALAMSADARVIVLAGFNNTIKRIDAAAGAPLDTSSADTGAASALVASQDGNLLAAGFSTSQVQLLDINTGKPKLRLVCGPEDADVLLAFAPDGQRLATVSLPDRITLWTTADGKEKQRLTLPQRDEVRCLTFSPDGRFLAVGYSHGGLRVWDTLTSAVIKHVPFPDGVWALAYAAGGETLVVSIEDKIVFLDTKNWQAVREYADLAETAACLAFSPDGRRLAAGMFTGSLCLFDIAKSQAQDSGEDVRAWMTHRGPVTSVGWSRNGSCLVTGGVDRMVRLWEFVNGKLIVEWAGHQGTVSAVSFHALGRTVVSASRDTTLLVWDVTLGTSMDPKGMRTTTLDRLWGELASDNNLVGNKAMWSLAAAPERAVAYLSRKVFDAKKIDQCIKDLDSKNNKERDQAIATLIGSGPWVEPYLRKALQDGPPKNVRQRINSVLDRFNDKNTLTLQQERLRLRRLIDILDQVDTQDARDLLHRLAVSAPEEDLRDLAKMVLDRQRSAA